MTCAKCMAAACTTYCKSSVPPIVCTFMPVCLVDSGLDGRRHACCLCRPLAELHCAYAEVGLHECQQEEQHDRPADQMNMWASACRAQDTLFGAPCLMRHTIDAQASKGFSNITAVYATPTTPGRCRAIIRNLFKFKSPIPRFFFSEYPQHAADGSVGMRHGMQHRRTAHHVCIALSLPEHSWALYRPCLCLSVLTACAFCWHTHPHVRFVITTV